MIFTPDPHWDNVGPDVWCPWREEIGGDPIVLTRGQEGAWHCDACGELGHKPI
jgi:hypothetical protein